MRRAVTLCAILLAAPLGLAQAPDPLAPGQARYHWFGDTRDPNVLRLYRQAAGAWEYVGSIDPEAGSWRWEPYGRPLDLLRVVGKARAPGALPAPERAPAPPPAGARPKIGVEETTDPPPPKARPADDRLADVIDGSPRAGPDFLGGVDRSKLASQPRYTIGGKEVGAAEALEAIQAGALPDDAGHVRVTVIGADAARRPVVEDLARAPALAWLKGRSVVNQYAAAHWRVRDGGFAVPADAGGVMIYAQAPDGKVLWRQEGYAGGPDALARALRDKVPGYDPARDPSPARPDSAPGPPANPWWLSVPGAALVVYLVRRWRKSP